MKCLKTRVWPRIGASAIVDLDTHDLMQPLEAIKKHGTWEIPDQAGVTVMRLKAKGRLRGG